MIGRKEFQHHHERDFLEHGIFASTSNVHEITMAVMGFRHIMLSLSTECVYKRFMSTTIPVSQKPRRIQFILQAKFTFWHQYIYHLKLRKPLSFNKHLIHQIPKKIHFLKLQ